MGRSIFYLESTVTVPYESPVSEDDVAIITIPTMSMYIPRTRCTYNRPSIKENGVFVELTQRQFRERVLYGGPSSVDTTEDEAKAVINLSQFPFDSFDDTVHMFQPTGDLHLAAV